MRSAHIFSEKRKTSGLDIFIKFDQHPCIKLPKEGNFQEFETEIGYELLT